MSSPPRSASHRVRVWHLLWAVLLAVAIVYESNHSDVATPGNIPNFDKLAHFSIFGLLASLVLRSFFDPRRLLRPALIAAAIVSVYGMTDEFHQSFTPGRSVDLFDWVADTTGALVAVTAYSYWPAYRRLLEMVIWPRPAAAAAIPPACVS